MSAPAIHAYDVFISYSHAKRGWVTQALAHGRQARRLAACDGPPDYTYKVAYDEAAALLARPGAGEAEA